ncbi:unnamed protein product, partial [Didymodactylos carnosus]
RPFDNTVTTGSVQVIVYQRLSWTQSSVFCDQTTINLKTLLVEGGEFDCYPTGSSACTSSGWPSPTAGIYCTDFSVNDDLTLGENFYTVSLLVNTSITVGLTNSEWSSQLEVGANSTWSITSTIDLLSRPDGLINTSPMVATLPILYKPVNIQQVHVVTMSDTDTTDVLKCRWATNASSVDECGGVCGSFPSATLYPDNCTLVFTLTEPGLYSAVALQIEDYYSSSSTTPMSSVPVQFLFYAYNESTVCTVKPQIIGQRFNGDCVAVIVGVVFNETVIAEAYCSGTTITSFSTSTPEGMTKSNIVQINSTFFTIVLSWTPQADQLGSHIFCAGAIDSLNVQSDQWCITYVESQAQQDTVVTYLDSAYACEAESRSSTTTTTTTAGTVPTVTKRANFTVIINTLVSSNLFIWNCSVEKRFFS